MALWIIEINDSALVAWHDGERVHTSPSVALVEARRVVTGASVQGPTVPRAC